MKGDFSRFTFNPKKRFSRVLMQQGRVQLDADWNEQLDITEHRIAAEITDFIGQSGAPEKYAGFAITPIPESLNPGSGSINPGSGSINPGSGSINPGSGSINPGSGSINPGSGSINPGSVPINPGSVPINPGSVPINPGSVPANLKIGAGRYYVEGMLFENNHDVLFTAQSDYPGGELPNDDGIYLAYLDVWQRHITALEDPDIREVALGGADTTTRVKNVWQVKLQWQATLEDEGKVDKSKYAPPDWKPSWVKRISTGKLSAKVASGANLENQLYRVEIHQGGTFDNTTFKWSRDNGSIATRVEKKFDGNQIPVSRLGQDIQTLFAAGQWIELSTEQQTLSGEPGLLVELDSVTGNTLTVKEWPGGTAPAFDPSMIVRRWDSGAINVQNDWITLENEIQVKFDLGEYKTGDYWLIPARNLTANIEWTPNEYQPPHGILHRYSSLALIKREKGQFTVKSDCRFIFKPLTTGLLSKGGDTMTGPLTINADLYVTGNVGIGTTSSINGKLDVRGDVYVGTGQNNEKHKLVIRGPNKPLGEGSFQDLSYEFTSAGSAIIRAFRGGGWDTHLQFLTNSDSSQSNAPQVRLNINGDGNIGIGTTAPKSKLAVSGGVAIGSNYSAKNAAPNNGLLVEGNVAIGGKIGEGIITQISQDNSQFNISLELASGSELYLLPAIVPQGHDSLTISITRNGEGWGNSSDWTIGCLFGAVVDYMGSGQQNGLNTYQIKSMKDQDNKWILEINQPPVMAANRYGIFIIIGRYK